MAGFRRSEPPPPAHRYSCGLAYPGLRTASITAALEEMYSGRRGGRYFEAVSLLVAAAVLATYPLQVTPLP